MVLGYRRSRTRVRRGSNSAMPDDRSATTPCVATSEESLASPEARRSTATPPRVGSPVSRRPLDCSQLLTCLDEPLIQGYRLTNVTVDASAREITCNLEVDREAVYLSYMEPGVRTWCSLLALHLRETTERNQYFDLDVGLLRLHF